MTKSFTYYPGRTTRAEVEAVWPNLEDDEWVDLQKETVPVELDLSEQEAKPNGAHVDHSGQTLNPTQQAAVEHIGLGFAIFRIERGTKDRFIDKNWATGGAITDRLKAVEWFAGPTPPNIGILMGDDKIAVDIDKHHGGNEAWAEYCNARGIDPNPETFEQNTPSGGRHLVFSTGGERFAQSDLVTDKIDTRTGNGYIVG